LTVVFLISAVASTLVGQITGYFRDRLSWLRFVMFTCWGLSALFVILGFVANRTEAHRALAGLWGQTVGLISGGGL
jgi:hypothetical protein